VLASRKVVDCKVSTEGSETAKAGTDEQEVHMRLHEPDEQAHHCEVQRIPIVHEVDVTGISRRNMLLPGEIQISAAMRWKEVSRGHSSRANELTLNVRGLSNR
jgi:hypothetical protein